MSFTIRCQQGSTGRWIAAICCLAMIASPTFGSDASSATTAERLVEEARQAQLEGNLARYFSLLRQAVRVAPDYGLAHWQLGQVQVHDKWLAVEEAQRLAAANPKQDEYRELRATYGETPQGQLALARWCRKNDLDDEARFHWASVLSIDPSNEEAMRAVDMRWHDGRLLTNDEIAQEKKRVRQAKRAAKRWAPTIARWRRDVSGSDAEKRDAALVEIRGLTDTGAIAAIEVITLGRDSRSERTAETCHLIGAAFLEALGKIPEQIAAESLVRHAVFSPMDDLRAAAIEKLKPRAQHDYVPLLLSGLAMPIESSFQVQTDPDGSVHYTHSLYREGPDRDWSMDARLSAMQYDLGGRMSVWNAADQILEVGPHTGTTPAALRQKASVATWYQNRYGNSAAQTEFQVQRVNQAADWLNSRIMPVLAGATGKDLEESPTAWWNWWRDRNEYYAPQEKDVDRRYVAQTDSYYYGFPANEYGYPPLPQPPRSMSCFAKGTLVWTKTGLKAIETLELGDLVLSQSVDTGELTFQPVIGRTVRPPSRIVKVSVGGEQLRTTLGHPLWVAGIGWRMAKEIEEGAILHGVVGSPRVEAVENDGEEEAYNLVVADFNTYFVGESGLLVHDNTPRQPTAATVPGLASK